MIYIVDDFRMNDFKILMRGTTLEEPTNNINEESDLEETKIVVKERASMGVIMRSEVHEEPTPPLKGEKREEDDAKNFKPKNKA
ncbi:hypothetical protein CWI36_0262p0040, partial [Hamiltosporidium magnivora]